ncbi:MAG: VTT domain-containing protein [Oscillospiraceae bacterium]|jgi:uncharacterized membrane protein YdjX (TVP38/TMEM64 family)|nr:VTT domain-containing protein [Oscillospiraceae bacterium]
MKDERSAVRLRRRHSLINLIGAFLLVVAGVLIAVLFYSNTPKLIEWYGLYIDRMYELENYVLDLSDVWLILLVVLLLYALKCVLPLIPIPVMCFITGAVLPMYLSFAVNIAGIMILVSLKYVWGSHLGGGQVKRMLELNRDLRTFLGSDSKSKPWLLFMFRLVPSFPINPVSQIYGAMGFDYADYVLISLLGFLPKLVSYIIVGKNAFRPLSIPFLIPLIIIFTLSGISVIGINLVLSKRQRGE